MYKKENKPPVLSEVTYKDNAKCLLRPECGIKTYEIQDNIPMALRQAGSSN